MAMPCCVGVKVVVDVCDLSIDRLRGGGTLRLGAARVGADEPLQAAFGGVFGDRC